MAGPIHKIKGALSLLSHGYMGVILKEVGRELASDETCYAFRRNLSRPFDARPATIPIAIRPFEKRDIALLGLGYRDSAQAVIDRVRRTRMIEAGIASHIYVAVTSDGSPCFIQCMISPAHNSKLSAYYKGYFPPLADDEVLLEGAFVPEHYRGAGIMRYAMSKVSEKGGAMGARWATTYVEESNLPSIRGCLACGFHPYLKKQATWRALKREVSFVPLHEAECTELEAYWKASRE